MKNFTDISNINLTEKDHLINEMVQTSGLDKIQSTILYDKFLFESNGTLDDIKSKFKDFTKVAGDGLSNIIDKISALLADLNINTNQIILDLIADKSTNPVSLIKIIVFILLAKDKTDFAKIVKNIKLDFELENLMESVSVINNVNANDGSAETPKEKAKFYGDLRTILAKNNDRYGNAYHLNDVHATIISYLDNEIEEIINKDNVNTVSDTFNDEFLQQLIVNKLNPMYRNINVLRTMIPDIQTLVFDMMSIVTAYVSQNATTMSYISRDTYNQYFDATKTLYYGISSSRKSSKVCVPFVEEKTDASKDKNEISYNPINKLLTTLQIDYDKFPIYNIQLVSIVDMVYIIKSCSTEFNLKTRSLLRNYVTKAFEILSKSEKIILEQHRINKYKN